MIKHIALILTSVAPLLMATQCNDKRTTKAGNCEDVICTMMFSSVNVSVENNDGSAAEVDEVYTLREATGEKLNFEQQMQNGNFVVLDDSYVKTLQNKSEQFRFVGMRGGQKMIDEPYTIGADCCHVSKSSGKDTIILP